MTIRQFLTRLRASNGGGDAEALQETVFIAIQRADAVVDAIKALASKLEEDSVHGKY